MNKEQGTLNFEVRVSFIIQHSLFLVRYSTGLPRTVPIAETPCSSLCLGGWYRRGIFRISMS